MPASASALDVSAVQSYASLSRRVTAYLLDLVIMLCVLMLVSITLRILNAFGLWTSLGGATGGNPVHLWHSLGIGSKLFVVSSFVLLMGPVYKILFEASPWQATFGKRLLKESAHPNDGAVALRNRKAKQEWAANATINREPAALKRMFRLGQQATPPKIRY